MAGLGKNNNILQGDSQLFSRSRVPKKDLPTAGHSDPGTDGVMKAAALVRANNHAIFNASGANTPPSSSSRSSPRGSGKKNNRWSPNVFEEVMGPKESKKSRNKGSFSPANIFSD